MNYTKALKAAGRLAVAARGVVGGKDLNGQKWRPADVKNINERVQRLESALAEYDAEIMALMEPGHD